MSRATTSGSTQIWASGQDGNSYNVFFDHTSSSYISHEIHVDNDFFRLMAFNLDVGESVVIEQLTGVSPIIATPYSPVKDAIELTKDRNTYVIERAGKYRLRLNAPLGHVCVVGFQFSMENEATQDIVEAITSLSTYTAPSLTVCETPTITPDIIGGVLKENLRISADPGNCLSVRSDGLYNPCPTVPSACNIGAVIPSAQAVNSVIGKDVNGCLEQFPLISSDVGNIATLHTDGVYVPAGQLPSACSLGGIIPTAVAVNSVVGKDSNGCLQQSPLVSSDTGNIISLHTNGLYATATSTPPPTACSVGNLAVPGTPTHLLGRDSNGCLVWFDIEGQNGVTITYDIVNHKYIFTNDCFPCAGTGAALSGRMCLVTAPANIGTGQCDDVPSTVNLNETVVYQVQAVAGGTGPYTYDWSTAVAGITATWDASLAGTPSITKTPTGNILTVSCTLTGATVPANNVPFTLNIPNTAYVTVTDSVGNSKRWYLTPTSGGSCTSVTLPPLAPVNLTALMTCTAPPCTPVTCSITQNGAWPTITPVSGLNTLSTSFSVDNNTASVNCGGVFSYAPILSIKISDPLHTMGPSLEYTVPNSDITNSIFYLLVDDGSGPGSDWTSSAVITNGSNNGVATMAWTSRVPPQTVGHGPLQNPTGHVMTITGSTSYIIPNALFTDGASHTININTANGSLTAVLGRDLNLPQFYACCEGSATSNDTATTLSATWGP